MTDQDVRDFFERLAAIEPMPAYDPAPLVRRGRRRLARNLAGGALAATIAVGAVLGGTSFLLSKGSAPAPAAPTGATSAPTTAPPSEPATSDVLTGNLVPDAGPFRRGDEVLERVCCDGAIAAVDPATGETRLLVEPADLGEAAWSPDGTRLAFEISCGLSGGNINNPGVPCSGAGSEEAGLYVMNATEEPTLIASYYRTGRSHMPYDRHFAWSPDGSKIAFAVLGAGLYVADADGSNATLVGSPSDAFHGPPSWAPDGSAITYATDDGVFVVASTGGEAPQLTDDGKDPVWSPDGSRIAFTRADAVFVATAATMNDCV